MSSQKDFEKALNVGRPPNIIKLFPNSKALIVSGKFIDLATPQKDSAVPIATNDNYGKTISNRSKFHSRRWQLRRNHIKSKYETFPKRMLEKNEKISFFERMFNLHQCSVAVYIVTEAKATHDKGSHINIGNGEVIGSTLIAGSQNKITGQYLQSCCMVSESPTKCKRQKLKYIIKNQKSGIERDDYEKYLQFFKIFANKILNFKLLRRVVKTISECLQSVFL